MEDLADDITAQLAKLAEEFCGGKTGAGRNKVNALVRAAFTVGWKEGQLHAIRVIVGTKTC